jgi:hypothetical protein
MKSKTISKILASKFNAWANSITDDELRKVVMENTIVTGGCITSMLLKEKVNDFDMYFRSRDVARRVAQYYVAEFLKKSGITFAGDDSRKVEIFVEDWEDRIHVKIKSAGIASEGRTSTYAYFEQHKDDVGEQYIDDVTSQVTKLDDAPAENLDKADEDYHPVFMSSNAITLSGKVQLIVRFFGEPEEIHKNYDFVHCTCYWKSWDEQIVTPVEALQSMLARELRYVGSKYPLCSIIRLRKFIARGWSINAGQILKMAMQLNKLELTDINVLEDQMIGVDAAYFAQVLDRLREQDSQHVDTAYLMTIIDRIF